MARVGEFVRDNASLGEIRKFEHNLKRRVKASLGPRVGLIVPALSYSEVLQALNLRT